MDGLRNLLFGCMHRNTSRPFTSRQRVMESGGRPNLSATYIVCLDCGKEFPYSLEEMRVLSPDELQQSDPELSPESSHKFSRWISRHVGWSSRRVADEPKRAG